MKMLKQIQVTTILFLTLSLIVPGTLIAQESIMVIMPRHEMDLKGIWEQQTAEFEQQTGIQVELIQMSWDEVADKVLTDLAAGGGSYDVIEFDNGWVAKFVAANWVEPLNSFANQDYINSLLPGLVSTFSRGGDVLGIPWNNDTRFFFYNTAHLEQAGIDAPPKTWTEMVAQVKMLKERGVCEYPTAQYWEQGWALANSIAFYLYSFGGDYFNAEGKITINQSPAIDALQFMVDMLTTHALAHPSSITLSQEAVGDLFYRGSTTFFIQGPPGTFNYGNDATKSNIVGQVGVASWLPAQSPEFQATLTLPEAFAIPKTSKNKEAAWKFIEFMISKEKDKERALEIGSLPLFTELYTDEELLKLYPYWKQFGAQSAVARALPQVEWYDELVQQAIVSVQGALLGSKSVQDAADEIADFLEGKPVDGKTLVR